MLGCGTRGTRPAADVKMGTGDSLNGGMMHCHDVRTGIDELSVCSASYLLVDCTSLSSLTA